MRQSPNRSIIRVAPHSARQRAKASNLEDVRLSLTRRRRSRIGATPEGRIKVDTEKDPLGGQLGNRPDFADWTRQVKAELSARADSQHLKPEFQGAARGLRRLWERSISAVLASAPRRGVKSFSQYGAARVRLRHLVPAGPAAASVTRCSSSSVIAKSTVSFVATSRR